MTTATWISASTKKAIQRARTDANELQGHRRHAQRARTKLFELEVVQAKSQSATQASYEAAVRALILDLVGKHFGYSNAELLGNSHRPDLAQARRVAVYIVERHTALTRQQLCRVFDRDRGSISQALRRVRPVIGYDQALKFQVAQLGERFVRALPPPPI